VRTGNNGYVDYRDDLPGLNAGMDFELLEICLLGSGAIAYLDFNVCRPV
jgi:hypothetical protein